ncbi:hypothetical protein KIW84_010302 [Lathyrus oleraceus]|uniref:(E)-beta-ocimene synthase n=1 Tax=Pisum sativum TaxID=3888 RepID=A0A9D4YKH5_PEA|nr:hypothetical protein KIW84_010302 [Pisum sativum]
MQEDMYAEKCKVLREEVRMMFNKMENEVDQLEFVDVLQRLGVDYHFNNEIRNMLDNIYNTQTSKLKNNLYATALKFRILRQHGYDISTDVFVGFQDEILDLKKDISAVDVEGMLSMYEASFHSFEDETILDEARDFTTKFLKDYLNQNGDNDIMSLQISHALELPLHWRIPRWETQWFINTYERQQKKNIDLLHFAKLDYNIVQNIYQEELKYTSRWWKRSELGEKLSFARDRIVENYVWTVGTNFKPDFDYFRKVMTKVNALITTIDDVYDLYGTLEELELFTEAIDRWDLNAMDSLPYYMKICFYTLYNFVNDLALDAMKNNGYHITPYIKKSWQDICKTYLIEAKWYHSGYKPSLEEYIENAWISISAPVILIHAYFLIPHSIKQQDLVCLEQSPDIIRYSSLLLRLPNDLGTFKGDIPKSIQCYMNETGASETEALVRRRGADGRIPVRTLDRGASSSAAAAEPAGYPGGSYDTSLLVKYEHHVARHIWFGEERGPKKELKVAGHGLKLTSRVPLALPPQMESWVSRSGLSSLQRTSLNKIDTNLVSAFVERWHLETSSFHMPFGEMSITLDDVACLLHLPIRGIFWSPQDVTEELVVELAVDYLGVSQGQAQSHVRSCRGSYYKLEWLYDLFVHHRAASNWAYATRAYLLMLVGSTIFAYKTFTLVDARYLLLFRDLDGCSGYSWGAAALVTLYRYLGDASMYSCKQLGGYPTLLQCWIHEYFPTIGKRGENWKPADNCGLPRAMRWSYRQGVLKVDDLRPILDELTPADVIWRPFEDHRAWCVFDEICLYMGCLQWGETVVPYLPNRCLHQFGYRQYVPSPPLDCMMATDIDVDWISYHQSVIAMMATDIEVVIHCFPTFNHVTYTVS